MVRIQKYISDCGYASRRKAEELIREGVVTVNGKTAQIGDKVDENTCSVKIHNKLIKPQEKKVYIMLNKPTGYLSSVTDDRGRKTVVDLIPASKERVFPVGRLDYDTEGLIILTNDGDFTYKITHPKHEIKKTYIATLSGIFTVENAEKLKNGIEIEDYVAVANEIKILKEKDKKSEVLITISQGKNRQVRKMFDKVGYPVLKLKRISIGNLKLGDIKTGEYKYLSKEELKKTGI